MLGMMRSAQRFISYPRSFARQIQSKASVGSQKLFVDKSEIETRKSKTTLGPTVSELPQVHEYMLNLLSTYRLSETQKSLIAEIDESPRSQMAGSQDEAQFLSFLCEILNAKKVLEVGVFRGSTTLALALSLPSNGKVVGLDISDEYTEIGRKYWKAAGVEHKVDLMIGKATESIETVLEN